MDVIDIAQKLGVPMAVLCFVGWAGVKIARWIGDNVAKPVTAAHLQMIGTLETATKTNADSQERTSVAVAKMAMALEKHGDDLAVIRKHVEDK